MANSAAFAHFPFILVAVLALLSLPVDARRQVLNPLEFARVAKAATADIRWPRNSRTERGMPVLEMRPRVFFSGPPLSDREESTKNLFDADDVRVRSLQDRFRSLERSTTDEISEAKIPLSSGIKLQTLNYIVTVEVGGKPTTLIMDTGSDLTWIQCKPCGSCYSQQEPLFDPSLSPSYAPIPCNSSTCSSLQLATGNSGTCGPVRPSCSYLLTYGDGSYTRGELARDRINLAGTTVDAFIFGCGRSNRGLFGGASGLMGLGRSPISLIAQTAPQFGGIFSYCLPSRNLDSSGSLILGDSSSSYKNTTPLAFTGIVANPQASPFYMLNLTGMSLGGVRLEASGFGTGKFLIDSGTVITRLPPSVYQALRIAFTRQFATYPAAPGFSILSSCFNLSGFKAVDVPLLRLEFEGGVEVSVDVSGMLYFVKRDASQACLAVASLTYEGQVGIIGNYQQKNLRVVYDTLNNRVGFAQETCGYV